MRTPLCLVVLPSGADAVFERLLAPAAVAAGLEPVRAEGLAHDLLVERLVLAEFAVVDLTDAAASRYYELGARHAARPYATVTVAAAGGDVPAADVLRYELDELEAAGARVLEALRAARTASARRPAAQLVDERPAPALDRLKTDLFRDRAHYSPRTRRALEQAREADDAEAVQAVEAALGSPEQAETGALVDLMLSYRAVQAWGRMLDLIARMPAPLARSVMVREQLGLALNRAGRGREAEAVLLDVLDERGPSSETLALLGRVYKDRWRAEHDDAALERAIDAYRRGFEADWRDAYPGVNAVTLMEIRDPGGGVQQELVPVVRYANRRRIDDAPDYWDHATRLELGVVARDHAEAEAGLRAALAAVREGWEPESTADNLALIRGARAARGEHVEWAEAIEHELRAARPLEIG